ncbi:hypothetical protein R6Q59_015429 [Mikania micrantha]
MASSPSNKEEMTQVVVYTRGIWSQNWDDDGNELDSVYTEHNGETITEHRFSMPLNFTCALLHEHVTSAIGSPTDYLSYVRHMGIAGQPHNICTVRYHERIRHGHPLQATCDRAVSFGETY